MGVHNQCVPPLNVPMAVGLLGGKAPVRPSRSLPDDRRGRALGKGRYGVALTTTIVGSALMSTRSFTTAVEERGSRTLSTF